jgi:hypothetical protein
VPVVPVVDLVHIIQEPLVLPHLFQIYLQLVAAAAQAKDKLQLLEVQVVVVLNLHNLDLLEIHPQQVLLKDLLEDLLAVHLVMEAVAAAVQLLLVKQDRPLAEEQAVLEQQHVLVQPRRQEVAAEVAAEAVQAIILLVQVALAEEEQDLHLLVQVELLERLTLAVAAAEEPMQDHS